jgi:glycosyltransferase involved in cell wall biosynthesis
MMVSFIVPVLNDAQGLTRCLASIHRAINGSSATEIIVVDNGSSDGSADVGRRADCAVLVIPGERVTTLRNRGAERAAGELLAFIDADHEIAPSWLSTALDVFADARVSAAGAPYSPPPDPTWVQRAYNALRDHTPGRRPIEWLASGNLAVRKNVFAKIGGFDPALEACEDVDLCQRIRSSGGLLVSDDGLHTTHFGDPRTLRQLFTSELWRGRNNLQVTLRERLTARSAVGLTIPVWQLTALAVALVSAATAQFPITLFSVVAFLLASLPRAVLLLGKGIPAAQAGTVALVYDAARALALIARKGHRRARVGGHAPADR